MKQKRNKKTILLEMPSLLRANPTLHFGPQWPICRKLPSLPKRKCEEVAEEMQQIIEKKKNKKRSGEAKCEHAGAQVYARDICQKCYNRLYNKIFRKDKYVK